MSCINCRIRQSRSLAEADGVKFLINCKGVWRMSENLSNIHVLDDNTINKIAAGEVVERPASVVKELVENSIDAGATKIEVEIMAGGTSFMRVSDNGKGMGLEDAKLAILRHATSKLSEARDLFSLSTLGFRGEALPSIAAVSRFMMQTRRKDSELGTKVVITGGSEPEFSEVGCAVGTMIRVEDLFFNTPARKKFLKTTNTEGSKINDFIVKLAISHPEISFKYISNNKVSIMTPGNGNLFDTLQAIYGSQVADALLGIDLVDPDVRVKGYVTKPSMIRSSRNWQTLIVNGRIISNKAVMKAIDNAYHSLVPKTGHPLAVLIIDVPPNTIDVNVHPQKSELKFEDEGRIFKAVYKAVLDAIRPAGQQLEDVAVNIRDKDKRFSVQEVEMEFIPATEPVPQESSNIGNMANSRESFGPGNSFSKEYVSDSSSSISFDEARSIISGNKKEMYSLNKDSQSDTTVVKSDNSSISEEINADMGNAGFNDGPMVPIGQVNKCYIIAQTSNNLFIIDQHAAHERILFDKFSAMSEKIPSQQLLVHMLMQFDSKESELIIEHGDLFKSLGFDMEPCGDKEFRLIEVPADIPVNEAEDIIREILESLMNMHNLTPAEIRHACLATTACRAAIKAGEVLNLRQMQIILDALGSTSRPYTCPHGRPTIIKFTGDDFAKMFKRTGF